MLKLIKIIFIMIIMAFEIPLTQQIEHSKSPEHIQNEVKSNLNEAKIIMDNVEKEV
jgi:hypothetical protein